MQNSVIDEYEERIRYLQSRVEELEAENRRLRESTESERRLLKQILATIDETNVAPEFTGEKAERILSLFTMTDPNAVINWKKATGTSPLHLRDYWCPQLRNCYSFTPLHVAAIKATPNSHKCFRHLVLLATQNKCDIDIPDIMGRSPLFYAAYYCNVFTVNYLIENGACATLLDYSGMDVLQYAKGSNIPAANTDKKRQKDEVIQLLITARQQPEADHCKTMNATIARVRAETVLPDTARELRNCIITTSRTFFALYSDYSHDEDGMHLTNPHFSVKQITVVSECRFPHFQLFENGSVLLMAYELFAGNRSQEQCEQCFSKACEETQCSFHQYKQQRDNPLGDRLGFFYTKPCVCCGEACPLHVLQRLLELVRNTPVQYIYNYSQSGMRTAVRQNEETGEAEDYVVNCD